MLKAETASRRPVFDWMRLISCIGIIGLHVTGDRSDPLGLFFEAFFRLWLPMFFLLSSVLILTSEREEGVGAFYLKRAEKVVVPFFLYGTYYTCWINQGHRVLELPTWESLKHAVSLIPLSWQQTFVGIQYFHLWFMYEIIGLYLIMPFLRKGLRSLDDGTYQKLLVVAFVLMACTDYLPVFGLSFTVDNYFAYWIVYLILGVGLCRDFCRRNYPWIVVIGGYAYLMSLRLKLLHFDVAERVGNYYDLSPHMMLQVAGVFAAFLLLEKGIGRFPRLNRVIAWMGRYTLGVYLIHGYVISWWGANHGTSNGTVYGTLHTLAVVFVCSFAFALVFDTLLTFPAQRGFRAFVRYGREKWTRSRC